MLTLYSFICFTNFVRDASSQYLMGFTASILVCVHLTVNLYLILALNVRRVVFKAKVCFVKIKIAKMKKARVNPNLKTPVINALP